MIQSTEWMNERTKSEEKNKSRPIEVFTKTKIENWMVLKFVAER